MRTKPGAIYGRCTAPTYLGGREILIPTNEKRAGRQAALAVRTRPVTLEPPQRRARLPPVAVWAVLAQEINPRGVEGVHLRHQVVCRMLRRNVR